MLVELCVAGAILMFFFCSDLRDRFFKALKNQSTLYQKYIKMHTYVKAHQNPDHASPSTHICLFCYFSLPYEWFKLDICVSMYVCVCVLVTIVKKSKYLINIAIHCYGSFLLYQENDDEIPNIP